MSDRACQPRQYISGAPPTTNLFTLIILPMWKLENLPLERQARLNRSTVGFSPLAYINIIERGNVQEWSELYRNCRVDAETRETVRQLLRMVDPIHGDAKRLWADLLSVPIPDDEQPFP